MMARSALVIGAIALVTLCFVGMASAHSWVGCTDYRGPVDFYDDSKCYAYPRNWETARAGALTPDAKGYFLGADTGYNYQGTETAACQLPMANPVTNAYTTNYPRAVYEQGKTYCLAWPMKNHGAATCTNQYIPDTSMLMFRSGVNPTSDPTQAAFKQHEVTQNFGVHTNGVIDCLGFQRSPKFCDNTDRALATGCFTVPADQAVGTYVYQWYWIFNQGTAPYTTCWDAQVVAAGSGRGSGGLINAVSMVDNLGAGGSTCQTNWAAQTGSVPVTAPTAATSTGTSSTPTTPTTTGVVVPINGDSVRVTSTPTTMPLSGSFTVNVQYAATGDRVIVVDILSAGATANWYGKGTAQISSAADATTTITLTLSSAPTAGAAYVLRAWLVAKTVYDAYLLEIQKPAAQQNTILAQPWTQELSRDDASIVAVSSTTPTTPSASSTGSHTTTTTHHSSSTGHATTTHASSSAASTDSAAASSSGTAVTTSTGVHDIDVIDRIIDRILHSSAASSSSAPVSVSGLLVGMALAAILAF
jgi:hypothetical protein